MTPQDGSGVPIHGLPKVPVPPVPPAFPLEPLEEPILRPMIPPTEAMLEALGEKLATGGPVTLDPIETRVMAAALRRLVAAEAEIETAQFVIRACDADAAAMGTVLNRALDAARETAATPGPARSFDTEASVRARSAMIAAARRDAAGAGILGAALRFAASYL